MGSTPRTVSGLGCDATTLASGSTTTCTVSLSRSASRFGTVVSLSSDNTMLAVPSSVTVAPGNTTATFTADSTPVINNQTATLSATLNGSTQTATITLDASTVISVSMTPGTTALNDLQTQQFTAVAAGTSNTAVTWALSPTVGSISSSGLYTAPSLIGATQTVTVTAISAADPTKSATAVITLKPLVAVTWTASASTGVSGYNVYRSGVSGGPYTKINPSLVAGLAYNDINVAQGNFYYYVLTAVSGTGQESAYSVEVQVLVQ